MGNFATASCESDPSPQPGLGPHKGTLWDPTAKIAPGQVARNSNLRFGDRPRGDRDSGESHLKIHYLVLFNGVYGFISNIMCGVYECV